jgi:hypothetical protein
MASDNATFLTEAPVSSLTEIKDLVLRLNTLVDSIDTHFVSTLAQHEQDFLKAYRGQMIKVERELRFMKQKQTELTGKLMGDDEITNL